MARPTKQGIDYFPMDCEPDGKLELFIAENGCDGFGLLVMIWQMIYKGEGYYIKKDDDLVLRLRKESLLPAEKIVSVIENSIKRGIFSIDAVDKHGILTSSGIQKRFFPAAKRKKHVTVFAEYLLIQVSEFENLVIVSNNLVSVCNNATNVKEEVNVKEEEDNTPLPPEGGALPSKKKIINQLAGELLNPGFSDDFMTRVWPAFVRNKKGKYKNLETQSIALKQLFDKSGGDEYTAVQALRETLANSYQGFTWYFEKTNNQNSNGTQRRNGTLAGQQPITAADLPDIMQSIADDPRYA